ncbi:MAG: hypothetical protein JW768_11230 [Chitinispirillaceae bacterium]|nr:hypothetical protein [Chitinispirillaceae bacterium]
MLITRDMTDFVLLLKKNRVRYMLVGGFAVIYYGYVRTTQDIDILVLPTPDNAEKMMKVLKEFGFGGAGFTRDVFEKEGAAIHLGTEPNRIFIRTCPATLIFRTRISLCSRRCPGYLFLASTIAAATFPDFPYAIFPERAGSLPSGSVEERVEGFFISTPLLSGEGHRG